MLDRFKRAKLNDKSIHVAAWTDLARDIALIKIGLSLVPVLVLAFVIVFLSSLLELIQSYHEAGILRGGNGSESRPCSSRADRAHLSGRRLHPDRNAQCLKDASEYTGERSGFPSPIERDA